MTKRLYIENPYLKDIDARIIDKIYMDGKYYITLNRTIFFPHLSGGQPGDSGTMNGIKVLEVYEEGSNIIHVIQENIHSDKVSLSIDWENRLDNMQQHTGQHLLSASFYKLYNVETIGFHIGKDYVYIDVSLPELSEKEIKRLEIYTNRIISLNFPIKSYYMEKNDLDRDNIRINEEFEFNSNIRIIEIENIDFSPCAGTHLRSSGEVGIVKIRKWEKHKNNTRIEFVCGNRALNDYDWKNKAIQKIALLLSSQDKSVYEKVETLFDQKNKLEKENRNLKEELYKYRAKELLNNSLKINNISFISKTFNKMDLNDLSILVAYLNEYNRVIQLFGSIIDDQAQIMINRSDDININLVKILDKISTRYKIKGGGNSKKIQGSCSKDDLENILNMFSIEIKNNI